MKYRIIATLLLLVVLGLALVAFQGGSGSSPTPSDDSGGIRLN